MLAIGNVMRSGGEAALSRAAAGMRVHGWMPSGETVLLRQSYCDELRRRRCGGELHARVWWRAEMCGDGRKGAAVSWSGGGGGRKAARGSRRERGNRREVAERAGG